MMRDALVKLGMPADRVLLESKELALTDRGPALTFRLY
jgi:hypothetical protein